MASGNGSVKTHRNENGTVIALSAEVSVAQNYFDPIHEKYRNEVEETSLNIAVNEEKGKVVFAREDLVSPAEILQ
jgi:hypothetical protein